MEPDYTHLHEISRHAIHVNETLEVATRSFKAILKQRDELTVLLDKSSSESWNARSDMLQLIAQVVENLFSRSEVNRLLVQNETTLVS